jgi:3-deoxy-manno-octulosonate cytidylyltransferase (CMP-KDO synthetase)
MSVAIIIPARLASTRLPRKLLLDLGGKSVLQRTFEQACKARRADSVIIATDAAEIAEAAKGFGGRAVLTRADHRSGTERIAEAAQLIDADTIVNIQGDEPEIDPAHIDQLIDAHQRAGRFAATLACPFPTDIDPNYPAAVKAILGDEIDHDHQLCEAKDFSRTPPVDLPKDRLFLHVGAYAFSRASLMRFVAAPPGVREQRESLEQLRIIEMGKKIAVRIVGRAARGIDTEEDIERARRRFGA